ncbi:MAG: hypothetical protein D6761_13435 [Candidatus Dadabacteria bacterium]|nr:MAG: hypothetical protein D6761_13435 [Candidatus Dadabacteria bacterium]
MYVRSLILLAALVASGCYSGPQIDPDAMSNAAGRQAAQFYQAVSEGRLAEAAAWFSERLRATYRDPLTEPLLAARRADEFVVARASVDSVDWRHRTVRFRVTLTGMPKRQEGVSTLSIPTVGTRIDAWILEEGVWRYDGEVPGS